MFFTNKDRAMLRLLEKQNRRNTSMIMAMIRHFADDKEHYGQIMEDADIIYEQLDVTKEENK